MNSETSQNLAKRRPIDWMTWSTRTILFVVIGICGFLIHQNSLSQIEVWVPVIDLPAYHLIVDSDVLKTSETSSSVSADVLSTDTSPVGSYTIQTVKQGHVLSQSNLYIPIDSQLTVNTIPISIPATAPMTFNGQLRSGAVVDVWIVRNLYATGSARSELILQGVLVLDVQQVENVAGNKNYPYIAVLAVPKADADELIAASTSNSLVFTIVP